MGLRDDIIATGKRPRKVKKVEGEPWGRDDVFVLKMNGAERDAYQMDVIARCDKEGNMNNITGWHAGVVALFACDEHGVKIFSKSDAQALNETDPDSLDIVFDAIREFNGLTQTQQDDLEKNSGSETGDTSSAGSHSNSTGRQSIELLDGSTVTT
jgi:hypothetical protein